MQPVDGKHLEHNDGSQGSNVQAVPEETQGAKLSRLLNEKISWCRAYGSFCLFAYATEMDKKTEPISRRWGFTGVPVTGCAKPGSCVYTPPWLGVVRPKSHKTSYRPKRRKK